MARSTDLVIFPNGRTLSAKMVFEHQNSTAKFKIQPLAEAGPNVFYSEYICLQLMLITLARSLIHTSRFLGEQEQYKSHHGILVPFGEGSCAGAISVRLR